MILIISYKGKSYLLLLLKSHFYLLWDLFQNFQSLYLNILNAFLVIDLDKY